jgi:hypothetical protein
MVLVVGSELLDDIRRAPVDVLSASEPLKEVCWCECAKRWTRTNMDYPDRSSKIHAEIIERGWYISHGHNAFPINAEYCKYFQGGPRRAHHGYGWSDPDTRGRCVAMSQAKTLYLTQHAEWVKVSILDALQRVICRAANRVFVGAPLCS